MRCRDAAEIEGKDGRASWVTECRNWSSCERPSHAFFRKTTTSFFQPMSLLARAPRLAARSARSNVLVQSRGMHGEYKVCLSQKGAFQAKMLTTYIAAHPIRLRQEGSSRY